MRKPKLTLSRPKPSLFPTLAQSPHLGTSGPPNLNRNTNNPISQVPLPRYTCLYSTRRRSPHTYRRALPESIAGPAGFPVAQERMVKVLEEEANRSHDASVDLSDKLSFFRLPGGKLSSSHDRTTALYTARYSTATRFARAQLPPSLTPTSKYVQRD